MIAIIGTGNVATHLYKAFKDKEEVCLVNPRTLDNFPSNPDFILICVSDDAIGEIINKIPVNDGIIAHTSGTVPLDVLKGKHADIGVFYPLQTFTKDVDLNYSEIPVFIEGNSLKVIEKLKSLARLFSENVRIADSKERGKLHLASVFACNFTNALAGIAYDILKDTQIEFKDIIPLMKQTVRKLTLLSPDKVQTGPAMRGDQKTIDKHLRILSDYPEYKNIYSQLTNLIKYVKTQNTTGK